MRHLICQTIFLFLEILMNIISLIILPKPFQFETDYFYDFFRDNIEDFDYYYDFYYLEEELSSPRKTSIAIIVFCSFICVIHLIKIILIIIFICENGCSNRNKDSIYWPIEFFNVPFLIIN